MPIYYYYFEAGGGGGQDINSHEMKMSFNVARNMQSGSSCALFTLIKYLTRGNDSCCTLHILNVLISGISQSCTIHGAGC